MYHFFLPYPWSNVQLYALLLSQVPHEVQVVAEKYCKKRETARVRTMYIYTHVYIICVTPSAHKRPFREINVITLNSTSAELAYNTHIYIGYISKYVRPQSSLMYPFT